MKNHGLLIEYLTFLKEKKKWFLLPLLIMLLIISVLIIVGQGSTLSPFVYALF